jgi:L-alanine-DL-glutamate epimerase-like enolase superfamily enzyme
MAEMFHRFHIHVRTGPVMYALSAIEIVLWDIAGKLASSPATDFGIKEPFRIQ